MSTKTNLELNRGADWAFTVTEGALDWTTVDDVEFQIRDRSGVLLANLATYCTKTNVHLAVSVPYTITDTFDWGTAFYTIAKTDGGVREVVMNGKVRAVATQVRVTP